MFGFFKKKTPKPASSFTNKINPADPSSPVLEAAIVKVRSGDESVLPVLFEALSHRTVTLLLQEPGKIQTSLLLEFAGAPHIAVFTKPQLALEWVKPPYQHTMEITMANLAALITSDTVGLTINPDHPIFGLPIPPAGFKHFRDVLSASCPLKEGGLYHFPNEDGSYGVLKILKLDEGGVHIRQYSNKFSSAPSAVEESTLYMAGMDRKPEENLGMGHLPISKNGFAGWRATFVQQSSVNDEELEGYKMWHDAKGGYF